MCILTTLLLLSTFSTCACAQLHHDSSLRGHEQVLRKLQAPSVSMYLMDADTNLELGIIQNGEALSLPSTVKNVNIEARPSASLKPGDRIQFGWNSIPIFRTEMKPPYAFCGDIAGKLNPCYELVINNTPTEVSATVLIGGENVASSTVIFSLQYVVEPPSSLPTTFPTIAPVESPSSLPTTSPTTAPVASPSSLPTTFPTTAPVESPVSLPPQVCGVPKVRHNVILAEID